MIKTHQPTIFESSVLAAISSSEDGHMKLANDDDVQTKQHIQEFVAKADIQPATLNYMRVTYDGDDYVRYFQVGAPAHPFTRIVADGLATNERGVGLFLPLADCTGTILYDPVHHALMVSHLGRHSTEQRGAIKSVEFMVREFASEPNDILVWMSPSPNGEVYPLWNRDDKSFREVNTADMVQAGIKPEHMEISAVDTVTDHNYFSHSEFLKGHREIDGRYAIVACLA